MFNLLLNKSLSLQSAKRDCIDPRSMCVSLWKFHTWAETTMDSQSWEEKICAFPSDCDYKFFQIAPEGLTNQIRMHLLNRLYQEHHMNILSWKCLGKENPQKKNFKSDEHRINNFKVDLTRQSIIEWRQYWWHGDFQLVDAIKARHKHKFWLESFCLIRYFDGFIILPFKSHYFQNQFVNLFFVPILFHVEIRKLA